MTIRTKNSDEEEEKSARDRWRDKVRKKEKKDSKRDRAEKVSPGNQEKIKSNRLKQEED